MPIVKNSGFFYAYEEGDRKSAIFGILGMGVIFDFLNIGLASGLRRAQNRTTWRTLTGTATSLTGSD